MKAEERHTIRMVVDMLRRLTSSSNLREPDRIYTVRQASAALTTIVDDALGGVPQIIQKRNKDLVLVIPEHLVVEMVRQSGSPASFADMFPVTETEPPLGELIVRQRPGRAKVRL